MYENQVPKSMESGWGDLKGPVILTNPPPLSTEAPRSSPLTSVPTYRHDSDNPREYLPPSTQGDPGHPKLHGRPTGVPTPTPFPIHTNRRWCPFPDPISGFTESYNINTQNEMTREL